MQKIAKYFVVMTLFLCAKIFGQNDFLQKTGNHLPFTVALAVDDKQKVEQFFVRYFIKNVKGQRLASVEKLYACADTLRDSLYFDYAEDLYHGTLVAEIYSMSGKYKQLYKSIELKKGVASWVDDLAELNPKTSKENVAQIANQIYEKYPEYEEISKQKESVLRYASARAIQEKNWEKALFFLEKMQNSPEKTYNTGLVALWQGNFVLAHEYLKDFKDTNAILVLLLLGKYQEALANIETIKNKSAVQYYLLALCAAALDNQILLTQSLKNAVYKNVQLKFVAQREPLFYKYQKIYAILQILR